MSFSDFIICFDEAFGEVTIATDSDLPLTLSLLESEIEISKVFKKIYER